MSIRHGTIETMSKHIPIGIIGDFNPANPTHVGTNAALESAAACQFEWLPTDAPHDYAKFDGLLCSPGSPYRSEAGALRAIQYARENQIPLLGTCGGFQHIVLDYARNVAGVNDAGHEENDPESSTLFVSRLTCSLVGKTMNVSIRPGTLAHRCYATNSAEEAYYCNFGLNPEYRDVLSKAGLAVSGEDQDGEARIVELPGHPFFIGTLFVPQMRSTKERVHPVIRAFLEAATAIRSKHGDKC